MFIHTNDHRLTCFERHVLQIAAARIQGMRRTAELERTMAALFGPPADKWNTASAVSYPNEVS
jgi:hypothetical protein